MPPSSVTTHPLLPPAPEENYTPLLQSEFTRIASSKPLKGIDTTRYESLAAPTSTAHDEASLAAWRDALTQAHTSHTYLSQRSTNLQGLEKDGKGKEDWLAGNEELVSELGQLEKELAGTKEAIDFLAVERRNRQEAVKGEMEALDRAWKGGVGRVLETEVAGESVRRQILDARRGGGV